MFGDDIFCEFAVFEGEELKNIPFGRGKIIWKEDGFDETVCIPRDDTKPIKQNPNIDWIVGEALTNLYVGLGRYRRGEKLSAYKFVQCYAVDRVVALISLLEEVQIDCSDHLDPARRLEFRYPRMSKDFSSYIQGYDKTPESALAILEFLDNNFEVNECIKTNILSLIMGNNQVP